MVDHAYFQPAEIEKLDPVVVNRIAAGEIIQRPANALKEMIENSLDAKSTNIQISVKNGGLKYLQIRDNGTGIRKSDLGIVCERFTTSKLKAFEDLQSISTYGFRGEALSSISHVAHLSIQTKTVNDKCASKASYEDGRLKGDIKSCAGNQGTQITVEDLFYNCTQRRQMFKTPSDEFQRILDVVTKYSIHNASVGFLLNKQGQMKPALRTPIKSTQTENIRIIYGSDVANALKEFSCESEQLQFKMNALATNVNYTAKKYIFLLFINSRLVECAGLKNVIDQVYTTFLPKGVHPFVYMHLQIEANNLDVNVHPTKHEVHFLYESEIIAKVREAFEEALVGANETRTLYMQQLLPGASDPLFDNDDDDKSKEAKVYAKDMIRVDTKEQKLDKFFGHRVNTSQIVTSSQNTILDDTIKEEMNDSSRSRFSEIAEFMDASSALEGVDTLEASVAFDALDTTEPLEQSGTTIKTITQPITTFMPILPTRSFEEHRKPTKLTSILLLREKVEKNCEAKLRRILAESVFVGCVNRGTILIQFDTGLFICDIQRLSEELFYQMLLYDFENFKQFSFQDPLSIKELAELALDNEESGWCEEDGAKDDLAQNVCDILMQKADMLREYYGIDITDDACLKAMPMLLDNHVPAMGHLPMYILRLATEVDWSQEKTCFETFSRETAQFYARTSYTTDEDHWKWQLEHIHYDYIKKYLIPSEQFKTSILRVTSLQKLYRVFERC